MLIHTTDGLNGQNLLEQVGDHSDVFCSIATPRHVAGSCPINVNAINIPNFLSVYD